MVENLSGMRFETLMAMRIHRLSRWGAKLILRRSRIAVEHSCKVFPVLS
jgi:hypothetical protein